MDDPFEKWLFIHKHYEQLHSKALVFEKTFTLKSNQFLKKIAVKTEHIKPKPELIPLNINGFSMKVRVFSKVTITFNYLDGIDGERGHNCWKVSNKDTRITIFLCFYHKISKAASQGCSIHECQAKVFLFRKVIGFNIKVKNLTLPSCDMEYFLCFEYLFNVIHIKLVSLCYFADTFHKLLIYNISLLTCQLIRINWFCQHFISKYHIIPCIDFTLGIFVRNSYKNNMRFATKVKCQWFIF